MKLDFSEIGNNVMPEGENLVTIFGAKETISKNGSSMLVLDMKNADGAFVRDYVVLAGAGAFRARQLFKALDIDEDTAEQMEASDLIGREVNVEIEMEEYNGEDRSRVKKYF